ncbi:MAG TPA: hypothetical protein VNU84_01175 [Candidatus Acidoferrum sp.]|nr:hypothetical protein [Candidatus Acidoferrum sp.]
MHDVSSNPTVERRRSGRVSESIPLIVRGVDLMGHPFEERTATIALNLQGCRYSSKHNLPRNSWVTIEVANGGNRRNVRGRVAWIHRPHSIRDFFQVAVELEEAANIWGLGTMPEGWPLLSPPQTFFSQDLPSGPEASFNSSEILMEGPTSSMNSYSPDSANHFEPNNTENVSGRTGDPNDPSAAIWRERLTSEMAVAQRQWDELLQSSIDRTLQRLAEQLPEHAQHAVRTTEEKMAEQFTNLGRLLAQMSSEAQNTLAGVKASIDQELWKARDTLESARQQTLERIAVDAEARVAPHAARVPELLRELSGREEQITESLRLHRDRLRQAADGTLREVAAQIEATAGGLRGEFEAARVEALAKWSEELDAISARAGHAASESISKTSEWLQQETRERLQVLAEQTLAATTSSFQEETTKATAQFATHLEGQSIFHLAQVHQQLDGVANDLTGRTRTQMAEAAEAAAASFGQVLHNMSGEHSQQFTQASQSAVEQKKQEIENLASQVQASFESNSASAIENLRQQTSSHLESTMNDARAVLAAEIAAALETHRAERDAHAQRWTENLNTIADQAAAQCNDRIQTATDAWTVASVRRLNEHGQNVIESLMRSADQSLRDSVSKIFEGLATTLRDHAMNASSAGASSAFGAPESQPTPFPPPQQDYSVQPGA